jgi:hypothetical protein
MSQDISPRERVRNHSHSGIQQFATARYPHATSLSSTAWRHRFKRLLTPGDMDVYLTLLLPPDAYASGPSTLAANPRLLLGERPHVKIILPRPHHEKPYWEDALSILAHHPPDVGEIPWHAPRYRLLLTGSHPSVLTNAAIPIIRLDVTPLTPAEVQILALIIRNLPSDPALSLLLAGVITGDRMNPHSGDNALDQLGVATILCPTLILDFIGMPPRVNDLLRSYVTETLADAPGAAPLKDFLEMRRDMLRKYGEIRWLPDEETIRNAWTM